MRMMGNLTEDMKIAIAELEGLESWIEAEQRLTGAQKAKQLTCLAHDWLAMDFEERAIKLLIKANKLSPGYFHATFVQHCKDTPKFALIAVKLAALLIGLEIEGGGLNH
jgi:hypothetical protein